MFPLEVFDRSVPSASKQSKNDPYGVCRGDSQVEHRDREEYCQDLLDVCYRVEDEVDFIMGRKWIEFTCYRHTQRTDFTIRSETNDI